MAKFLKKLFQDFLQCFQQKPLVKDEPKLLNSLLISLPNTCFFLDKYTFSGAEGFEPANDGTKNRSLTTWRHPKL